MQVTIKGHIYAVGTRHFDSKTAKFIDGPRFEFAECATLGGSKCFEDYVLVGPVEFPFEVPDEFDPRAALVKNLEAEKKRLMADFNQRVTEIDRQIQTYLAIEA
jgi:hypothetical protein